MSTNQKPNPLSTSMENGSFAGCKLALFNSKPESPEPGKSYPLMRGFIECNAFKVDLAGFSALSDSGTKYLSLSVGNSEQVKVYGRLFKNTAEGKENEYYGSIEVSRKLVDGTFEPVWQVGIRAKRATAESTGLSYISGTVYRHGGQRKATAADDAGDDLAF